MKYEVQCPYCHAAQSVDHAGGYAPMYADCPKCDNRFIVEPVRSGVMTYRTEDAPCCSDPDCRAMEMGDSGNE
ncbi:MAG: hypothetical protein ACNI3A_11050 [Desulfovibrio sp.]|uniref:hypothetical protein n=1 Tax=Desulfovibrio sp. 7SRBS1 TaxID=3378064 RepID=UPI003B3E9DCF